MFSKRTKAYRADLLCMLKNRYSNLFSQHSKPLIQGRILNEHEYLRDLAVELNNVAADLYTSNDRSFAIVLYKGAIKAMMSAIQPKENRILSIEEAKASFINQIVKGKQRLHNTISSSSQKKDESALDSYQWSDSDSHVTPRCLSEAMKVSNLCQRLPQNNEQYVSAAIMMYNMGLIHVKNREYNVAEQIFELAIALRPSSDDTSDDVSNALVFAAIYNNLGFIQYRNQNLAEARDTFYKARDIGNQVLEQSTDDKNVTIRRNKYVGTILYNIGIVESHFESACDKVTKSFEYSLALQKMALGDNNPDIAILEHNIGMVYLEIGRVNEAEKAFLESLRLIRFAYGNNHRNAAKELFHIGRIHAMKGEYDMALYVYQQTLRIEGKTLRMNHPDSIITMCEIGQMHHSNGELEKALSVYNDALESAKAVAGILSKPVVSILCKIIKIHIEKGEMSEAVIIHKEVARKVEYLNRMNIAVDRVELSQISDFLVNPPAAAAA